MADSTLRKIGPIATPGFKSRHVRVHTPHGRDTRGAPVLYVFDGQNVFGDEEAFSTGWHLHEALEAMGPSAPVVVAIDNGGEDRVHELGPWPTSDGGGRADAFLAWMTDTLIPSLVGELGLAADPDLVAVGGSSLGGLAALYAHHRHPEHFGRVLSMSPSLWYADERIIQHVTAAPRPSKSKIYVDAGAREEKGMLERCARLVEALAQKGYGEAELRLRVDPRGGHCEAAWRARLPEALAFLFSDLAADGFQDARAA